ncbi:hypothetical protein [Kribbella sp. NPDC006257]|uniref:hypothetical protein n=1 Tax=Kribbella sp. NPDC006257 TaxID=3156738 RepID=UPI0033BC2A42
MAITAPLPTRVGSTCPQPVYGAVGWSQTVESPARYTTRGAAAGFTVSEPMAGALPSKVMLKPDVPVPPWPVGWPSGVRTLTVAVVRTTCPAVVATVLNTCLRASTDIAVLADRVELPRSTVTS